MTEKEAKKQPEGYAKPLSLVCHTEFVVEKPNLTIPLSRPYIVSGEGCSQ